MDGNEILYTKSFDFNFIKKIIEKFYERFTLQKIMLILHANIKEDIKSKLKKKPPNQQK